MGVEPAVVFSVKALFDSLVSTPSRGTELHSPPHRRICNYSLHFLRQGLTMTGLVACYVSHDGLDFLEMSLLLLLRDGLKGWCHARQFWLLTKEAGREGELLLTGCQRFGFWQLILASGSSRWGGQGWVSRNSEHG